jgi:hypothetical protein
MCSVHHKIIDGPANEELYSVAKLLSIKHAHEAHAQAHGVQVPALSEALVGKLLASIKPSAGDESDFENGLRVSTLFIANAVNEQGNGLSVH